MTRYACYGKAEAAHRARIKAEIEAETIAAVVALGVALGAHLIHEHVCQRDGRCRECFAALQLVLLCEAIERGDWRPK